MTIAVDWDVKHLIKPTGSKKGHKSVKILPMIFELNLDLYLTLLYPFVKFE